MSQIETADSLVPWLFRRPVSDVTRGDVRRWYADLRRAGSPRTAQRIGTILTQAFEVAVEDETIDRNPAREAQRRKGKRRPEERRTVKVLTAEETARLLRALDFEDQNRRLVRAFGTWSAAIDIVLRETRTQFARSAIAVAEAAASAERVA